MPDYQNFKLSKIQNLKLKIQKILRKNGVGVLPTDTLYGLVGSAFSKKAVARIYKLKKRNPKKPLIVLIGSFHDLARFGVKPDKATLEILRCVWPGKVSVILPCHNKKFRYLHRGTNTAAFRIPAKKSLRALFAKIGPLVAPSANPKGRMPATTIREAKRYFGDAVDFYAAGGTIHSSPSTLIAIKNRHITTIRRGSIGLSR